MIGIGVVSEAEIAAVIPAFYAKVRKDPMLGPIFNDAIGDWPEHLEKLQAFWSSVMLASGRYKGQPMPAHVRHAARITPAAFARWLELWDETTRELLPAEAAAAMQDRAERIAESLALGIQLYQAREAELAAAD
ncbi:MULTISPECIES: group III truncated hemoglobin [Sphingomonas]|jgi:hemoglobin|uniref:Group III truncated hemoglobin n=1 Tax=Sphingomonas baiyangensis TaxID=2572576 RepID=A0A4U1L5N9_9SPHN|nr:MULTISPECIES: group III truncated hemoglobin [Sphingomonas]KKI17950.1 preprotein translocase subunit TatC [Sphingomonas sp. Ag1]TKD51526.1 group III truncated hemoglobin [Sphingomonas baiyangensis]